jgi:ribose 5-phosphate isomerase A
MKEALAESILSRIKNGQVIGIGSGSTVEIVLTKAKEVISKNSYTIYAVPTSSRTAQLASAAGFTVLHPQSVKKIDWAFDGADEIDPSLSLIKGHGGALLSEKIIAKRAGGLVVIATSEKQVKKLGERFTLPVEIIPDALQDVEQALLSLGATEVKIRQGTGKFGPVVTEYGNWIVDIKAPAFTKDFDNQLKLITGVVETGLFFDLTKEAIIATENKILILK